MFSSGAGERESECEGEGEGAGERARSTPLGATRASLQGRARAGLGQGRAGQWNGQSVGSPDSVGTAGAVSVRPPADACLDFVYRIHGEKFKGRERGRERRN